ncbi:transcription-repair coupling factor [Egicoccus halophilus]|uniref:Transcription-repair-coupling factor n=1 Tax=Egicoccus halophilus TaxID=1670830 RepID=A0A8J3A840_9ACTN|nr:transcription-repair coupling factor [Egicoccus halophilus]GGI03719.1 transcription-repair-coupling factor [Egicoccus halophilus]
MSAPSSIDDVLDPGLAVGPLAAALRPGRAAWPEEFEAPDELVCTPALRPYVLSLLAERARPLLVLTPRTSDAEAVADGIAAYLGEDRVAVFPAWETLPHERLSPQPRTVGRRLAVLDRLCHPQAHEQPLQVIVAPVRAAVQPMDPALTRQRPLELTARWGGFDALVEGLAALGYSRTTQVEARGEFAVRGGIVDLFPTGGDQAVRVEFWGDDVESLRAFSVGDQRSTEPLERVVIDPARELVLDEALRAAARGRLADWPELTESLDKLAEGQTFEGAEALVLLLRDEPALLSDFLPEGAGLALIDPMLLQDRATKLREEAEVLAETAWRTAAFAGQDGAALDGLAGAEVPLQGTNFASPDQLLARSPDCVWRLTPFGGVDGGPREGHRAGGTRLPGTAWDSFRGDVVTLSERANMLLRDGKRVVVAVDADGPARRIADVLGEQGVPASIVPALAPQPVGQRVEVTVSRLRTGFASDELGLAVLGTWDVFGPRRRRASRRLGTRTNAADAVVQLREGDPVVHRTHGVGRYRGMVTREFPGPGGTPAKRDYVLLEYADGDTLYVPSDQVDAVTKYQGGETPSVMSLGGAQWERAKNRVRKAVRDIAADLIRLYAARMHAPGTAFSPDGAMQAELEDAFAHVETVDQLTTIEEIKRDMEAPIPMDRLLAGDVGFGKTEVAVRAAGKSVFDGKQVAVLVPTTILAQQHFETFKERFAGFPVEVEALSRFTTAKDRKRILDGLAAGTVDVVVGTHSLLARTVQWKELGLVVVDEEQRFGVAQKERLKQLRTSVDVLSMSATPIPRTLEMAVSGLRDLSVIETPPEDRQPVMTVVSEYDESQIALAIRRELLRDGQVFYVHNQVDTIHRVAAGIVEMVPGARVEVAHGQMDERQLERVMVRFWEREFDVLVCTTIVESGLDVPNANTLIIERADLLGLSQLHQLRGRVGRSAERGYAYFLYPQGASITEPAYERLKTIAEHTRLGSGLAIAMRDLEIRGAGNVVGAEQSGQVAAVGFEMYSQLLKEEVADLSGQPVEPEVEIKLELPVDAHLPHDYVEDERQRLELYKRISAIRDAGGVRDAKAELADRFGPLPEPAERLLTLAALKAALRRWRITEVTLTPAGRLRVVPMDLSESQLVRLERLHRGFKYSREQLTLQLPVPSPRPADLVGWVAATLRDLVAPAKKR